MDAEGFSRLDAELRARVTEDRALLTALRNEIRPLRHGTVKIQRRSATAVSFVGTDGGNNQLQFDPFLVQLVRIVDSSNNQYCLEVVTPTTDVHALSAQQFGANGEPVTALGRMMAFLGVADLPALSPMIQPSVPHRPVKTSWVQVYRELVEWAILFDLVRSKDYGSDTLLVVDGLLRSKVFRGDLFARYKDGLAEGIERSLAQRRKIYLVGLAKRSKVLDRYRLAMALEGILRTEYPAYVDVPREIEEKAYIWSEYARGDEREITGEANKFVAGKMFLVKFGSRPHDPIWPVDIFTPQIPEAQTILGFLMADAEDGFPIPHYPRSLQRAHEHAALAGFDFAVFQDRIFDAIGEAIGDEDRAALDTFRLQDADPAAQRY